MNRLAHEVQINIHRDVLDVIFAECDRYDQDETGGRLIGTYQAAAHGRGQSITVSGVIEPGPNAIRTSSTFFQDGVHQERVFRQIESVYPEVEHLGNWHTHHVNGYPTLSAGDRATYHRIVNHHNHNTDFFYALLITKRNSTDSKQDRYSVKHFIIYRGDPEEYELSPSQIHLVDQPVLRPSPPPRSDFPSTAQPAKLLSNQRALDNEFLRELCPDLRPFFSKKTQSLYWRGKLSLVDDTSTEIVITESNESGAPTYAVKMTQEPAASTQTARALSNRQFKSAREAAVLVERDLNREIFKSRTREKA